MAEGWVNPSGKEVETMPRTRVLRRFGAMLLLVAGVSIGTSACLLVPVPVDGHRHHYWHR
jgi:hypothetical protein